MENSFYIIVVIMNLIKHFWAIDASRYYFSDWFWPQEHTSMTANGKQKRQ